ncbi:MAG: NAD-dependent epimerase/dehydratase family protein [Thermodesulfobacteriota bacterium]|nr:NAD-dependent epimerase/dehydratase family protein [Thermodesulfobacteriota bacterium]
MKPTNPTNPSKPKTALVTGGAGFIGSHVVERLVQRGIKTVVLDDLSVGKKENLPEASELVIGDICDPLVVKSVLDGVDVVFHLAARVSIRDSFRGLVEDAGTNVMGTVNLLKHIEETGVKKFIYASSMATYGDSNYLPIDEKHPLDPTSPYGISKLAGEKYVLCSCRHHGIEPVILRYFNTYGPRQTQTPYVGVITIFIHKLLNEEDLPIFGTGSQVRDFINVEDVAEATLLAMDYQGATNTFNVGTGTGTDINTLSEILKDAMNKSVRLNYLSEQPGEPSDSIADISLAKRELGFTPRWSLREKLPEVVEWNIRKQTQ